MSVTSSTHLRGAINNLSYLTPNQKVGISKILDESDKNVNLGAFNQRFLAILEFYSDPKRESVPELRSTIKELLGDMNTTYPGATARHKPILNVDQAEGKQIKIIANSLLNIEQNLPYSPAELRTRIGAVASVAIAVAGVGLAYYTGRMDALPLIGKYFSPVSP